MTTDDTDHDAPRAPAGLYTKFVVRRVDGRDQAGGDRHGADYLVLDLAYDGFARQAALAYAAEVGEGFPQLAADILARYGLEPRTEKLPTLSDVHLATEDDCELGPCASCGEDIVLGQRVVWVPAGFGPPDGMVIDHLWCAVMNDEIDLGLGLR